MPDIKKYFRWYALGVLIVLVIGIWSTLIWIEEHRGRASLSVFDVGQGDAIFIEAPNGNQVLVDGGPGGAVLAELGGVMLPWDHSIDVLVLTHPHADHLNGLLEVLKRYDVGMVVESGVNHTIPEYDEWHRIIAEREIPLVVAANGTTLHLGEGADLRILTPFRSYVDTSPRNVHDAVVVTEFHYASSTALLMGDAELSVERELASRRSFPDADVLKVGHHGSKTSTSEMLLRAVAPKFAVISVGAKNRYGLPAQEVLDRLVRFGVSVFRTDRDGTIRFMSDGMEFRPR